MTELISNLNAFTPIKITSFDFVGTYNYIISYSRKFTLFIVQEEIEMFTFSICKQKESCKLASTILY